MTDWPDANTLPRTNTAREALLDRLAGSAFRLAVHELRIVGHSENALATELSDMAREKIVAGRYRKGKKFKEWTLASLDSVIS